MADAVQLYSWLLLYELYSTLFHFDPPTQNTILIMKLLLSAVKLEVEMTDLSVNVMTIGIISLRPLMK